MESPRPLAIETVEEAATPGRLLVNGCYEVERDALERIRRAPLQEHDRLAICHEEHWRRLLLAEKDPARRPALYAEAYGGLSRIYHAHGQFAAGAGDAFVRLLAPWVGGKRVLEIGCGSGVLAQGIAGLVAAYKGIDASAPAIAKARELNAGRARVEFACGSLPGALAGHAGWDLVYSNDFLEHLHPDDVEETVRLARLALAPGGKLVIIAPNRLFGPFDSSRTYVAEGSPARGLHLSEPTHGELAALLARQGFSRVLSPLGPLGAFLAARRVPLAARLLLAPVAWKERAERSAPLRAALRRPLGLSAVIVVAAA